MAVLTNKSIASTYTSLLSIGASTTSSLSGSIQALTDGTGQLSPLAMSTTQIQFNTGSNTFKFPTTRGTSGQILKLADANGTLGWVADSVASTLNFSGGGSTTGSIALNTETLAFTGTANEIVTSASNQAITLSFPTAGVTLPNGSIATTQSASNNSTKVATTAYVEAAVAAGGDVTKTGTIALNTIAVWNNNADQLRSDTTMSINTNHTISLLQPNNVPTDVSSYNIGGGNIPNVTGQNNTGFGQGNLQRVTTGLNNVAFGGGVLDKLTIGSNNVGVGKGSLFSCTEGDANTGVGEGSLADLTTGDNNTALGEGTGIDITTTSGNTFIGKDSGRQGTGSNNTYVGFNSGSSLVGGDNNVIIGSNTGSTISTTSNNIIISDGGGNNRLQFGSTGTATFKATTPSPVVSTPIVSIEDSVNGVLGGIGALASGGYPLQIWGGTLEFKTGSSSNIATATTKLSISSGGDATFQKSIKFEDGAAWAGAASIRRQSNALIFTGGASGYYFNDDTNSVSNLIISSGGKVGIGTVPSEMLHIKSTSSPEIRLQGAGHSWYIRAYNDNYNVYSPSGRQNVSYLNNGDVRNYNNSTTWQTSSDVRVKENINTISDATSKVLALNPVIYDYKQEFAEKNNWDNDKKINNVGFIAQEFESVFPKYVSTNECVIGETTIDDFKSIDTGHLVAYLVKSIQEQQTIIEDLKSRIETLEG